MKGFIQIKLTYALWIRMNNRRSEKSDDLKKVEAVIDLVPWFEGVWSSLGRWLIAPMRSSPPKKVRFSFPRTILAHFPLS